ncbi:phosphatidylinositol-glycan biosynthesis class W protein [Alligator mississippiensis]|uniref:phosphatidylinositol-glycan biosynthesis class W protein n=1 Tax=Alligator mississippiensis TaxID=8496 RepID=UPI0003D0C256|nr:phosphatidylinositol-glycan biosynthesis class W protein [Alligator mississippiensis]XP_019348917.1 phosphatidylinositol-glycan biosynthesis class W protein [Alligator mississippiensis]XP_019348918.1 phosphatidylinositol-glycan biosynthesis class W protein [Alligator mississippiensis]XP_019348919.1 phosphatidylinositol-glycan biosynthesis class W protein [Alligator mississippiensis]
MSQKLQKEAFISNLNGTTLQEISVGLTLAPLCVACRGLLLVLYHQHYGRPLSSRKYLLLLDLTVLVAPLVLSCTVLSPVLPFVPVTIVLICAGLFSKIYHGRNRYVGAPCRQIISEFLKTSLDPEYVPSITVFRVYVNLLTAISILAVDFPQYPRRYAKTETYGTGVMDFGVGAFIFGNALVCPEVRQKSGAVQAKFSYLARQSLAVWPLVFLGLGRLVSVKAVDYHEHLSEYGVHWNFFFTLAFVRIAASLLLSLVPAQKSGIVAVILAVFYQFILDVTPLKMFVFYGSDGRDSRVGFLNANREGVFSLFGYLAIYMASVQVGLYVLKKRTLVKDWIEVICLFLLTVILLFICLHLTQTYIDLVSRRLANLAFCIWVVAHGLTFFILFLVTDLILVLTKLLVNGSGVPCCWNVSQPPSTNKKHDSEPTSIKREEKLLSVCIITAINKNQLVFFLLANVMTGIVNMVIDTIHSSTVVTLFVLHLYMFTNCLTMHILHAKNLILKWW